MHLTKCASGGFVVLETLDTGIAIWKLAEVARLYIYLNVQALNDQQRATDRLAWGNLQKYVCWDADPGGRAA
jgi:hypothetical protein